MSEANYSFYALPAAVLLAYIPQFMKGAIIARNVGKYDNVNPRQQLELFKDRMPKAAYAKAQRAMAAHINGLENFPIFATAILAANAANLPASTVNTYSAIYLLTRFVYNFVYINNTNAVLASMRSLVWMTGFGTCLTLMFKAAAAKM